MKKTSSISATKIKKIIEDFDLGNHDFFDKNCAHPENLEEAKIVQRLMRLVCGKEKEPTKNECQTIANLKNNGLHSAFQIASLPQENFLQNHADCFASKKQAIQIHARALASKSKTLNKYFAIAQHRDPFYLSTRLANLGEATSALYSALPSYEGLFGGLDFCECSDCRSVLSPAAYFTDLMRMQQLYITGTNNLQTRRGDLWTTSLSCTNTNTLISKLEIVNPLLQTASGISDMSDLGTTIYPFNFPINFATSSAVKYLQASNLSLPQIWNQILPTPTESQQNIINIQTLGITLEQWQVFNSSSISNTNINLYEMYGLAAATDVPNLATISNFLAQTGISYNQLNELLYQDLSATEISNNINANFFVNFGSAKPIVIDGETLDNSNVSPYYFFDNAHRFIRAAQALNWSYAELDLALNSTGQTFSEDSSFWWNALPILAWIKNIKDQNSNLSMEQICAFLSHIKIYGEKNGPSFWQSIFQSQFATPDSPFANLDPQNSATVWPKWTVPTPGNSGQNSTPLDMEIQTNLSIALRLNNNNLLAVGQTLIAIATAKTGKAVTALTLDLPTQALFYRVSILPLIAGAPLPQLALLYGLQNPGQNFLNDILTTDISELITITNNLIAGVSALQQNNISIYQLQYWLTGNSFDLSIKNQILSSNITANFISGVLTSLGAISFTQESIAQAGASVISYIGIDNIAATLFTYLANDVLNGVVVTIPTAATISAYIQTLTPTPTQANSDALATEIFNALTNYQNSQLANLDQQLAGLFGIDSQTAGILAQVCQITVENFTIASESATITTQLLLMQTYVNAIKALKISAFEVLLIDQDPGSIGPDSSGFMTYSNIESLLQLLEMKQNLADRYDDLLSFLASTAPTAATETADIKNLASITGWEEDQLNGLITTIWKTSTTDNYPTNSRTIAGLCQLNRYFTFAQTLNCNISVLIQAWNLSTLAPPNIIYDVVSADYQTYYQQWQFFASQVWNAYLAQNAGNSDAISSVNNSLLNLQRDLLVPLAILQLSLTDTNSLSEYLLTDIEADAIVETSKIVEAISAVQTYIYRCRNYLEAGAIVNDELSDFWPWMENYRLWEANREVFLYPENYIEPDLRKNKSTLFTKFQSDLQQGNISDDSMIEDAIRNYLDGFSAVSNIEIIGSCVYDNYDQALPENSSKNIFFVGVSNTNPVKYFYLTGVFTIDQDGNYAPATWGEWLPINCDLQPQGKITPIFAFGKWFIFWVEKAQVDQTGDSSAPLKNYSYSAQYANLNNAGNWSAKQTLATNKTPAPLPEGFSPLIEIYPIYFNSIQTLFVPYEQFDSDSTSTTPQLFPICLNNQNFNLSYNRYIGNDVPLLPTILQETTLATYKKNLSYYRNFSTTLPEISDVNGNGFTLSAWFNLDLLPSTPLNLVSYGTSSTATQTLTLQVNNDGALILNSATTSTLTNTPITAGNWHHLALCYAPLSSYTIPAFQNNVSSISNIIPIGNNSLGLAWSSSGSNPHLYYGILTFDYNAGTYTNLNPTNVDSSTNPIDLISLVSGQYNGTAVEFVCYASSKDALGVIKIYPIVSGVVPVLFSTIQTHSALTFLRMISIGDQSGTTQLGYFYSSGNSSVANLPAGTFTLATTIQWQGKPATINGLLDAIYFDKQIYLLLNTSIGFILASCSNVNAALNPVALIKPLATATSSVSLFMNDNVTLSIVMPTMNATQYQANWILDVQQDLNNTDVNGNFRDNSSEIIFISNTPVLPDSIFPAVATGDEGELGMLQISNGNMQFFSPTVEFIGSAIYLDGELVNATNAIEITSTDPIVATLGTATGFPGSMQEVIQFENYLAADDAINLYQNSANYITDNFDNYLAADDYFGIDLDSGQPVFVMSQPNWNAAEFSACNISTLNIPNNSDTELRSYRMNSNAVASLESNLSLMGLDGMLAVPSQLTLESDFNALLPEDNVIPPSTTIDFFVGPMSNYYWELFFYIPFYVARQLQNQQLFEAAKSWFEYILDPAIPQSQWDLFGANENDNDKYWRFVGLRSFYNPTLNQEINENWSTEIQTDASAGSAQLYEYHNDPFDPNAIARLRPISYQKTILMHYVGNIISWADNLYRQYNEESIGEALMLYMTASDLLGQKPQDLGVCPMPPETNFAGILKAYPNDNIPEFIIEIEQSTPASLGVTYGDSPVNYIANAYFGLPQNAQLNDYWDQIAQRLYNIRHSLTIDGVFEQIPLFAPEINPMDLVQAVSSGQSLEQVLSTLQNTIPYYRFEVMVEKSKEMANLLIQFGQSLLSALEKQDAEQLERIYNLNQQNIFALTTTIKQNELNAATQNLQSMQAALQNAQDRYTFYSNLITDGLLGTESSQIELDTAAMALQYTAQGIKGIAAGVYMVPTIFGFADGGMSPGDSVAQGSAILEGTAQGLSMTAGSLGNISSFARRKQDWQLQQTLANDDIKQINFQILAAQYQEFIANQEIQILQKNIAQQQAVYQFLTAKFSSKELYQWISGQLAGLYFQAYQLAYKTAKQAESSWIFEKGLPSGNSVFQANYWNNLYQGLTCGEALLFDIHRCEQAYMEQNSRRLEIRKTLQLSSINNGALITDLKNGSCVINLTQAMFDGDFSGHYCRQIKSISLSFPALIGPYQNIHATLTQNSNFTLLYPDTTGLAYMSTQSGNVPNSVRANAMPNQEIVLSEGIDDSGMITFNFSDGRYLPFEGTGAVSNWTLAIPKTDPLLANLNDVIMQINYSALQG